MKHGGRERVQSLFRSIGRVLSDSVCWVITQCHTLQRQCCGLIVFYRVVVPPAQPWCYVWWYNNLAYGSTGHTHSLKALTMMSCGTKKHFTTEYHVDLIMINILSWIRHLASCLGKILTERIMTNHVEVYKLLLFIIFFIFFLEKSVL